MKRLLPLLLILPLAGFRPAPPLPAPDAGPVSLHLVDRETGQVLRSAPGEGQRWVAGERGHRYAVRLRNASPERVLVVLSVDGVNAISGEDADPSQTGYVLSPWQTAEITGWRKTQDEVARFVFSTPGGSYASRTGRPDNVGVVGIAVFQEAGRVRMEHAPKARRLPLPAPSARSMAEAPAAEASADRAESRMVQSPAPALGTGHGEREASSVRDTAFERATRSPVQVAQLRYDSVRNLRARGIVIAPPTPHEPRTPQAFPQRYVPDPPAR